MAVGAGRAWAKGHQWESPSSFLQLNATPATPNSTIRSALGGSVFHSPVSHPPPSGSKVGISPTPQD